MSSAPRPTARQPRAGAGRSTLDRRRVGQPALSSSAEALGSRQRGLLRDQPLPSLALAPLPLRQRAALIPARRGLALVVPPHAVFTVPVRKPSRVRAARHAPCAVVRYNGAEASNVRSEQAEHASAARRAKCEHNRPNWPRTESKVAEPRRPGEVWALSWVVADELAQSCNKTYVSSA